MYTHHMTEIAPPPTSPPPTETPPSETSAAASRDGTTIGYRTLGRGPGLVVVHGTMSSGQSHVELAAALADAFTVHLLDRRGRGLSGPPGEGYGLGKEVEDLDAVLAATGAENVFAVSSGAIVTLQHAVTRPAARRLAIFEPPFLAPSTGELLARFDREIARGDVPAALVTAMLGTQMGAPLMRAMPRWLLERLTAAMLAAQDRSAKPGYVTMRTLAPLVRLDGQLIIEAGARLEPFRAVQAEVLLIGGGKSPRYLKEGHDRLEKLLPHVERVELAGLDHAASWNRDQRGKPAVVAGELRRFFAGA
jgi:pimeloyl-ACP methyl ester carboxylesterase